MKIKKSYLVIVLLLLGVRIVSAQESPVMRSVRTTVYEAVQKDMAWTTGKVIDNIYFVKYDFKGRMSVENLLKPDGSPQDKILYRYDAGDRVVKEIYATAKAGGVVYCWDYGYDAGGRINTITTLNGQQDTLAIVTAFYDADGKVTQRLLDERWNGTRRVVELNDTVRLKRRSTSYMTQWRTPEEQKEAVTEKDEYGNWTRKITYLPDGITPEYITCRDIVYEGMTSDLGKIPLQGKVKRVTQFSYIAVPKGPETVLRGKKKGRFFVYDFDERGRKTGEETFTEAGLPVEKMRYEYNEDGDLMKEIHFTPTGALTKRIEYMYNAEGLCRNGSIYNGKGELVEKVLYRYDLEGNRIQETVYGQSGTKNEDYRYYYDSYGQQIERRIYASTKEEMHPYRRAWNFQQRITREEIPLPGGGCNVYTYRYNKKGEVIAGTEQLEGQPEVKYIYKFHKDEKGNWKIRIKYVNEVPVVYEERKYEYYNARK